MAQKNCTFTINEDDDPRIRAFWDTQPNKGKLIKFLIIKFLDEQGIYNPEDMINFNVKTKYQIDESK